MGISSTKTREKNEFPPPHRKIKFHDYTALCDYFPSILFLKLCTYIRRTSEATERPARGLLC